MLFLVRYLKIGFILLCLQGFTVYDLDAFFLI